MFVGTRRAMAGSSSGSAMRTRSAATRLCRIAMRVSMSGGCTSTSRPHSKRERRRSARSEISRGARSELSTSWRPLACKRVEGVEELLLDAFLARQELDVVDQEDVELLAVAPLEGVHALVLDGRDELVREGLAGHVARSHARRVHEHVVRDRLQQVRLAEAGVAVDHERVVGLARRLGDGQGGRVGEAVGAADHERAERVLGAQRLGLGRRAGRACRPWRLGRLAARLPARRHRRRAPRPARRR